MTTTARDVGAAAANGKRVRVPRLGFLGVGWIGRNRLEAVARSGLAEIAAIADANEDAAREAASPFAAEAVVGRSLEDLLDPALALDGVVIATPSAQHADQAVEAARNDLAVFVQKPVGRTAEETRRVVDAARQTDVLLGVDMAYRFTAAARSMHRVVTSGDIGSIYAADLVFHNAYGPDKAWFYDPERSGGGCVIDLGIHLVDMALWMLGFPDVEDVSARLFANGEPWTAGAGTEDFAVARLDVAGGAVVTLSCSWNLPAGRDAVIGATFYGRDGAVALHNVDGSFFDLAAERYRGTKTETLAEPPDEWPGRAAVEWVRRVAAGEGFDATTGEELVSVATVIDRIYGR